MSKREAEKRVYPVSNPGALVQERRDEYLAGLTAVVDSGRYVGGPAVEEFEKSMAAYLGTEHVVGVSNGLDALRLIFEGYIKLGRLKEGDKVLIPANTYIASALSVTDAGLVPVPVDVSFRTLNLDSSLLEEAIGKAEADGSKVRALLTVHLYGRTAWDEKMGQIAREHNLIVVEDLAQAIGAEYIAPDGSRRRAGSLGDAAGLSFYPTKNLGAMGDAGAVATSDSELAKAVRALANYGSDRRYHNIYQGYNCRLDPIQAAVLSVGLRHFEDDNRKREMLASFYYDWLRNPAVKLPDQAPEGTNVYHQMVVRFPADKRDKWREELAAEGVMTDIHYPEPFYRQPCYSGASWAQSTWPVTERLADEIVSIPVYPVMEPVDIAAVSQIINKLK